MNTQPEALRLAELIEAGPRRSGDAATAAELRRLHKQNDEFVAGIIAMTGTINRLHALNQELLEAVKMWLHLHDSPAGYEGKYGKALDAAINAQQAKLDDAANTSRAAIAKAEAANG